MHYPNIKVARKAYQYGIDHSLEAEWDEKMITFMKRKIKKNLQDTKYSYRYIGSLVADAHRTLFYGGILLYPETRNYPSGVINITEAIAISHVFERSWGRASCGEIGGIL